MRTPELNQKVIEGDFFGHFIERHAGMGLNPMIESAGGRAGIAEMERPDDGNEDACGEPAGEDLDGEGHTAVSASVGDFMPQRAAGAVLPLSRRAAVMIRY